MLVEQQTRDRVLRRTEILPDGAISPKNERVSIPKYVRVSVGNRGNVRQVGSDKTEPITIGGFLIPDWAMGEKTRASRRTFSSPTTLPTVGSCTPSSCYNDIP